MAAARPIGLWAVWWETGASERWYEATVSTSRHGDVAGLCTFAFIQTRDTSNYCPGAAVTDYEDTCQCANWPRIAHEFGEGCIKVMSESEEDSIEVCRQKNTTPGSSFYQEAVDLYVRVRVGGEQVHHQQFRAPRYAPCKQSIDPNSEDVFNGCLGSMIALAVKTGPDASEVRLYSSGKLGPSDALPWLPQWTRIGRWNFSTPLTKQGLQASSSVLFAGLRMAD